MKCIEAEKSHKHAKSAFLHAFDFFVFGKQPLRMRAVILVRCMQNAGQNQWGAFHLHLLTLELRFFGIK